MVIKQYITWTRKFNGNLTWIDPSYEANIQWKGIVKMTETGFGYTDKDKRLIGIIEYDDSFTKLDRYINNYNGYSFNLITIDKALSLCIEWYGKDMFSLDGDVLIDNRPIEEV